MTTQVARDLAVVVSSHNRASQLDRLLAGWRPRPLRWLDRRDCSLRANRDSGVEPFWASGERPVWLLTSNLDARRDVVEGSGDCSLCFPRCRGRVWLRRFWEQGGRAL